MPQPVDNFPGLYTSTSDSPDTCRQPFGKLIRRYAEHIGSVLVTYLLVLRLQLANENATQRELNVMTSTLFRYRKGQLELHGTEGG